MRALITGGTGFIGTHLAEYLLSNGMTVSIFDKENTDRIPDFDITPFNFIKGDILDSSQIMEAIHGHDVVFHLAGILGTEYTIQKPIETIDVNIKGTINVLQGIHDSGALLVYLSLLPDWNSPYMITKHAAEKFCRLFKEEFGVRVIIVQATHVYGERQKWLPTKKAVPSFIHAALRNQPIEIYGTGNQLMDLIYIKDVVNVLVTLSLSDRAIGETVELGSGEGIKVIDLARLIIKMCNSNSNVIFKGHRPGEPMDECSFLPARIEKLTEFIPGLKETNLEEGLLKTIAWYRENPE